MAATERNLPGRDEGEVTVNVIQTDSQSEI
jgi:hypothetical protein